MKLGKLDRYRVICGTIDKIIMASSSMDAATKVIKNADGDTLDSRHVTVQCNYGYGEYRPTVKYSVDKVLKNCGFEFE